MKNFAEFIQNLFYIIIYFTLQVIETVNETGGLFVVPSIVIG